MGRTNPTYRTYLERYERKWAPFRRGLRRQHKPSFDRLFEKAGRHADAAGQQNAANPEIAVLVSILLAQEIELSALRRRLDAHDSDKRDSAAAPGG